MEGVGLAGCGRMGEPMLAALIAAGFAARGFDIRAAESYGALAPHINNDADSFARDLQVLITVVRDIAQTEDVLFSTQGIVARATALHTVIVSSTLSPRYVRALRDRIPAHVALIDAPMSGASVAARARRLSFMLGGAPADLDRMQPLFAAMGAHFHRMGGFGTGMAAKVLNNLLAASSTAMTRLVLDWAAAEGLDQRRLLDLIATSSGQNWLASGFDEIEFARDGWSPDNSIGILVKDVESALDAAPESADTTLPRAVRATIRALTPTTTPPRRPPEDSRD